MSTPTATVDREAAPVDAAQEISHAPPRLSTGYAVLDAAGRVLVWFPPSLHDVFDASEAMRDLAEARYVMRCEDGAVTHRRPRQRRLDARAA